MKKTKPILLFILLLAGFLRFYKLAEYPVGFHIDEASLGYNAYSLLKTGRDENGQLLPLHIDMFGDFRPAGYQYLDILPVWLFGLSELATRLPSALFGTLTVLAIYLLTRELFLIRRPTVRGGHLPTSEEGLRLITRSLPLVTGLLLAISPWHVVISRASAETIVALFFIILGTYFFLAGIKGKQKQFLWATLCWSASLFFYHSSRVFVPLLGAVFSILLYPLWKKQKRNFKSTLLIFLLTIFLLSLFLLFGTKGGAGRFRQVSIFHFPEIRLVLEEQLREDGVVGVPILLVRAFHNKVVNYGLGYLREYFRYFSPSYLFIEGGLPKWYLVPSMGLMYLIELPFLLVGLYQLVRKGMRERMFLIPVIWLILGPSIGAVTRDDVPNVQRSLVMLPALVMITAYGLWWAIEWMRKGWHKEIQKVIILGLILAFSWNFGYFLHQYAVHSRVHRPWYRFNGFKEMVLAVNELAPDYDKIAVTKSQGGIYMHFLFFQQVDPQWYQNLGSPRDKDYGGFGKLIFVPQDCPTGLPDGALRSGEKVLYVAGGNCGEPPFSSHETQLIKREDGTVAFRVYPGGLTDE